MYKEAKKKYRKEHSFDTDVEEPAVRQSAVVEGHIFALQAALCALPHTAVSDCSQKPCLSSVAFQLAFC